MKWKLSIVQEVDDDPIFQMESWGTDMPYHRLQNMVSSRIKTRSRRNMAASHLPMEWQE